MELVTGKAGTPHVSSADDGRRIAGEVGTGNYVLQTGGKLAPSLVDSNTVRFATGDLIVQGRHIGVTEPEDVKVASGTQGKKRMDYICIHYTKDVSGSSPTLVEKVEWKVLQGTPGGTATAPTVPAGSIIEGDAEATVPVASVTFDGLTTGTPQLLVDVLAPLSSISGHTIKKINFTKAVEDSELTISGVVVDGVATVICSWTNAGFFQTQTWDSTILASMDVSADPESFSVFVDNMSRENQESRLICAAGNHIAFRTAYSASIDANTWHAGSVSFRVSS